VTGSPSEREVFIADEPSVVDAGVTNGAPVNRVGYLYLFASVFLMGLAVHLIKVGLRSCTPNSAIVIVTLSAGTGVLLASAFSRLVGWRSSPFLSATPGNSWREMTRYWKWLLPATVIGMLGGWTGTVVVKLYTASMAMFLGNQTLVFLVIGGVVLGDRLSVRELFYITMVMSGALLFAWTGEAVAWFAVGIMGISCVCTAVKQVLIKQAVSRGGLWELMAAQQYMMAAWGFVLGAATGHLEIPPLSSALLIILGGTLQSFLGMGLLYAGYREVGIARGAPINAMRPLMVLVVGLMIGTETLGLMQAAGGALVLAGSALLAGSRR
jgi:drug/metabolite transporter (DMT)-like permease